MMVDHALYAFTTDDHRFMQQALRLAAAATRNAAPNPGVGCVLVREGRLLAAGMTQPPGADHAEIQVLKECLRGGESAAGATLYVTLEPCSHHGRTPPCATALVQHGIARVVFSIVDPFPAVSGKGLTLLREAGIEVCHGLMEDEARRVHRGFLSRVRRRRPWVTVKAAATLDGKTALLNGQSQWITGPDARRDVQALRATQCALLTGSGTVRADNPRLTVRGVASQRQPLRVVVDGQLVTSAGSVVYQAGGALLVTTVTDKVRHQQWEATGTEILVLPSLQDGHVDLSALLCWLAERGINELMVEAGAGLNGALVGAGLVDDIVLYLAPYLLGDMARGLFAWPPLVDLSDKTPVVIRDVRRIGTDVRVDLQLVNKK